MATQPTKWTAEPATTADKVVIPVTAGADDVDMTKLFPSSFELPLDAGGKAVARREMNTLIGELQQNTYFMQQGGVYDYSADIDYTVGTRVLYNGDLYKCIQDNGVSSTIADPTNTVYWDKFVTQSEVSASLTSAVPIGTILPFGGSTPPNDYLLCDGTAVSRSTYAGLFAAIGTKHGAGDGSTTFNLPNLINKFPRGSGTSNVGTVYPATLPSLVAVSAGEHTHGIYEAGAHSHYTTFNLDHATGDYGNAVFGDEIAYGQTNVGTSVAGQHSHSMTSAGAHTHTVTNQNGVATGTTVLPDSVGVLYIIKYR